jgi:hypothetical protein
LWPWPKPVRVRSTTPLHRSHLESGPEFLSVILEPHLCTKVALLPYPWVIRPFATRRRSGPMGTAGEPQKWGFEVKRARSSESGSFRSAEASRSAWALGCRQFPGGPGRGFPG